eukprot:TRINITY_DN19633_c0_g1_i1.p1 TRINITY_DN19633_c0_g1~~TRINITY_DN19633_c0_g1_i1.p1  ORF type:complete len:120 (-),score=26.99 TRINITY_DN19633_c0_g1_i1:104-463(-)
MIRRPPRSTQSRSSAASDVYKRQYQRRVHGVPISSLQTQALSIGLNPNDEVIERLSSRTYLGFPFITSLQSRSRREFPLSEDEDNLANQDFDTDGYVLASSQQIKHSALFKPARPSKKD